jgi:hypothetical protein
MRLRELSISVATILSLAATPALATPKGAPPKSGAPTTTTHSSPKTTTSSSPKTTTHGNSSTATAHGNANTTTTTHGGPKSTTSTTHGSPKTATSHDRSKKIAPTTSTAATGSTGGTTTTTTTAPLNPIAQKISSKSQLNTKVTGMLPKNVTLDQASIGFKNQGQFIAALHVSQNLGIPFADLKTAMTGIRPVTTTTTTGGHTTTGSSTGSSTGSTTSTTATTPLLSLGQAIHKLRPSADSIAAETTATRQATSDLGGR